MSRHKFIWITIHILTCIQIVLTSGNGLQGVPTWMCLGVKSPFIEFTAEFEHLSNESISFNISDIRVDVNQPQRRKNGIHTLGNFINPISSQDEKSFKGINNTVFSIQSDLLDAKDSRKHQEKHLQELQQQQILELQKHNFSKAANNKILLDLIKPIVTDSHKQQQPTSDDDEIAQANAENSPIKIIANSDSHHERMSSNFNYQHQDDPSRNIMPLALKTTMIEKERPLPPNFPLPPVQKLTTKPPTNINDLKNHLLMLQNFSQMDKSFQNQFVVFKEPTTTRATTTTSTTTTTRRPTTESFPTTIYRSKPSINMPLHNSQILRDVSNTFTRVERVTVAPQVILQNDQEQPDTQQQTEKPSKNGKRRGEKGGKKKERKQKKNENEKLINDDNTFRRRVPFTTSAPPSQKKSMTMTRAEQQRMRKFNLKQQTTQSISSSNHQNQRKKAPEAPFIINLNDGKNIVGGQQQQKLIRTSRSKQIPNGMRRRSFTDESAKSSSGNKTLTEKLDLNPRHCSSITALTKGQRKICEQFTSLMPSISRGARAAIQECQHQFQNRRWNCTTYHNDDSVFGPITSVGTPEMAFIHALASATTASFIARACRDGQLASCGCSRSVRPDQLHEDWTWGGCGDDLEFGYKFSQNFIDIREKELKRGARELVSVPPTKSELMGNETAEETSTTTQMSTTRSPEEQAVLDDMLKLQKKITEELLNSNLEENERSELQMKINKEILNSKIFNVNSDDSNGMKRKKLGRLKQSSLKARTLMNLHNNEVGRRAVIKKHRIICKCHGVSGSCSLVTCWQQLSTIREIGDFLREKYEQATQVKMNKRGRLQVRDSRFKVPTALDLVYLDESPDWCRVNKQLQWTGTHGRKCNKTSTGLDSCSLLCCGRGYNTKKIVIQERCNCKFQWCCSVRCDTCKRVITEYTCK